MLSIILILGPGLVIRDFMTSGAHDLLEKFQFQLTLNQNIQLQILTAFSGCIKLHILCENVHTHTHTIVLMELRNT